MAAEQPYHDYLSCLRHAWRAARTRQGQQKRGMDLMAQVVEGTFSGTGASDGVHGRKIQVMMDFTGTASVDIEVFGPGNAWIKYGQPITADHYSVIDDPAGVSVRLNC